MPQVDTEGHMTHTPGRELFDSGVNRHGVSFRIYRTGRVAFERYVVEMEYSTSEVYKSGCLALDVARNTRMIRKVERAKKESE